MKKENLQGSLYYQPKQCKLLLREIPQNYHAFVVFDSPWKLHTAALSVPGNSATGQFDTVWVGGQNTTQAADANVALVPPKFRKLDEMRQRWVGGLWF